MGSKTEPKEKPMRVRMTLIGAVLCTCLVVVPLAGRAIAGSPVDPISIFGFIIQLLQDSEHANGPTEKRHRYVEDRVVKKYGPSAKQIALLITRAIDKELAPGGKLDKLVEERVRIAVNKMPMYGKNFHISPDETKKSELPPDESKKPGNKSLDEDRDDKRGKATKQDVIFKAVLRHPEDDDHLKLRQLKLNESKAKLAPPPTASQPKVVAPNIIEFEAKKAPDTVRTPSPTSKKADCFFCPRTK